MADESTIRAELNPQYGNLSAGLRTSGSSVNADMGLRQVTRHAETAERLANPRRISVAGDVVGDTMFDGSEDVIIGTAVEVLTTLEIDALMESAMTIGG